MLIVPPVWFRAAIEFAAVPVLRRAAMVSVPPDIFNAAGAPAILPMRELFASAVLIRIGALEPWPKFNVPPTISNWTGVVMGVDEPLSTSVQFALLFTLMMF